MLIFVYNAKNDFKSKTFDFAHKIFSPSTYQCDLCSLTYGNFKIKKQWKVFLNDLKTPCKFMYSNEFHQQYPNNSYSLPAVFLEEEKNLSPIIKAKDFGELKDLEALLSLLKKKLN